MKKGFWDFWGWKNLKNRLDKIFWTWFFLFKSCFFYNQFSPWIGKLFVVLTLNTTRFESKAWAMLKRSELEDWKWTKIHAELHLNTKMNIYGLNLKGIRTRNKIKQGLKIQYLVILRIQIPKNIPIFLCGSLVVFGFSQISRGIYPS